MLSLFFLISLCLVQANSFAVPYAFAKFGPEVTSSFHKAEELSFLCVASVRKLMAQNKLKKLFGLAQWHYRKPPGICLNQGSFWQVLDTYNRNAKICEGDSSCNFLHAQGWYPKSYWKQDRLSAVILHQILGLQKDEAICDDQHQVCKEYAKVQQWNREAALRNDCFQRLATREWLSWMSLRAYNLICPWRHSARHNLYSAPALTRSATDLVVIIFSAGMIRRWKIQDQHAALVNNDSDLCQEPYYTEHEQSPHFNHYWLLLHIILHKMV